MVASAHNDLLSRQMMHRRVRQKKTNKKTHTHTQGRINHKKTVDEVAVRHTVNAELFKLVLVCELTQIYKNITEIYYTVCMFLIYMFNIWVK